MVQDLHCKQCGEPYSAYSLRHDVAEWENQPDDAYDKFMNGEGCPTCDWGDKDVDNSGGKSEAEKTVQHAKDIVFNSDDDPAKYF